MKKRKPAVKGFEDTIRAFQGDVTEKANVRIKTRNNTIVGAGVIFGVSQIITCAHVVTKALELSETPLKPPEEEICFDFPLVNSDVNFTAKVETWMPHIKSDIATLRFKIDQPTNILPATFAKFDKIQNLNFTSYGYPVGHDDGLWVLGKILRPIANGWYQVQDDNRLGYFISEGFSGAAAWQPDLGIVLGIIVARDRIPNVAYIIPSFRLQNEIPSIGFIHSDYEEKKSPSSKDIIPPSLRQKGSKGVIDRIIDRLESNSLTNPGYLTNPNITPTFVPVSFDPTSKRRNKGVRRIRDVRDLSVSAKKKYEEVEDIKISELADLPVGSQVSENIIAGTGEQPVILEIRFEITVRLSLSVINALRKLVSEIVSIPEKRIKVMLAKKGSVILQIELPALAARELMKMFVNKETVIKWAKITDVHIRFASGDPPPSGGGGADPENRVKYRRRKFPPSSDIGPDQPTTGKRIP